MILTVRGRTAVAGKIHSHHSSAHSPAYSPPTTLPQPPSPSRWQRLRSLHARTPREHKAPRAPTSPCRFHRSKFNAAPRRRRGTSTSRAREPSIPSIPTPKFLHRRSRGTRIARHSPPVPLRPRLISSRRRPRSEGGGGERAHDVRARRGRRLARRRLRGGRPGVSGIPLRLICSLHSCSR